MYPSQNGFMCDINIDFEYFEECYQMDDGNLIIHTQADQIKIIKIQPNSIEVIWKSEKKTDKFKQLLKNIFFIKITEFSTESNNKYYEEHIKYVHKYSLYIYKMIN